MGVNDYKNRAEIKQAAQGSARVGVTRDSILDANLSMHTVQNCAIPAYTMLRSGITGADAAGKPAAVPEWDGVGYWGLHCYYTTNGAGTGESMDIELWAEGESGEWFLVDSVLGTGVASNTELRFDGMVRNRPVALVVRAITLGGYTSFDLKASWE